MNTVGEIGDFWVDRVCRVRFSRMTSLDFWNVDLWLDPFGWHAMKWLDI